MAEDPERTGADLARMASEAKAGARKADNAARKQARELARTHNPKGAMDDVLKAAGQQAGNVILLPRTGTRAATPHETPALKEALRAADAADTRTDADTDTGPDTEAQATSRPRRGSRKTAAGSPALEAAARLLLDQDHDWNGG